MRTVTIKRTLYNETVDVLLQLMNKAKEIGYELSFEDISEITNTDVKSKIDFITNADLVTSTSINKMYLENEKLFKNKIKSYMVTPSH